MHHILCRVFCKTSNHWGDSTLLQPRFGARWLRVFPKTKITFEKEEISEHRWDSGKCDGAADGDWEKCVRSSAMYFEGHWGVFDVCTMFLVSYIFNKCLYFSYYMAGYLLDKPCICFRKVGHLMSVSSSLSVSVGHWKARIRLFYLARLLSQQFLLAKCSPEPHIVKEERKDLPSKLAACLPTWYSQWIEPSWRKSLFLICPSCPHIQVTRLSVMPRVKL